MWISRSNRSRIIPSSILLLLLLVSPAATNYAVSAASPPWHMFRGNPQHTGRSPYLGASTNSTKWKFPTGGAIYSSPAIGVDDAIYVGSFDGSLYAINPDGDLRWRFQTGEYTESSPAIASDGTVYVGSFDGNLYAINPDGSLKWKFGTGYHGFGSSPTIGPDGTIYFGGSYCCVYAVNPDGRMKWNATTDAGVASSPAIGPDGTIYVGGYDFSLDAMTSDGKQKWKMPIPGVVYSSPAIGPDGTIYVGTIGPFLGSGELLAVTPDGNQKWTFPVVQPILSSTAIASDGTLYVEALDGHLYALNPDGSVKWKANPGGVSSPVIGADGTIYAASLYDGSILAVDQSGAIRWHYTTGKYIGSSPSIAPDGTIYVGSYDGNLYAIGSSSMTTSSSKNSSVTSSTTSISHTATASITTSECQGFAYVENAALMLCGRPFSFIGAVDQTILAPYLGYPYGSWFWGVPDPSARISDAASNGIKVIRFFLEIGDQLGTSYVGNGTSATCIYCGHAFDSFWQAYSKEPDHRTFFLGLDRLVADAKRNGVYLEPNLMVCPTCWSKLGNGTDFFKVNSTANIVWKNFVRSVVSHYRNETQILWWGLTNEGNNVINGDTYLYNGNITSPTELVRWANDSYDFIKSIDPNHLEEGGWNIPWSGYWTYYGGGENAHQKVVSEYNNMTFFRALNARFDVATLHVYDVDIYNGKQFIGADNLQNATAKFVEHYADYSHNVFRKPFFIDETGGQLWGSVQLFRIGYSPSPFVKYLLQAMVKYHVVGEMFWGWEEDLGPYYMSAQATPEIANWFKYYSDMLISTKPIPEFQDQALVLMLAFSLILAVALGPVAKRKVGKERRANSRVD